MIFLATVSSTLAIMTESPKCVYAHFPKVFEALSIEHPQELGDIYQKLKLAKSPPCHNVIKSPPKEGWSAISAPVKRNRKDIWALILFVISLVLYIFCAGIF